MTWRTLIVLAGTALVAADASGQQSPADARKQAAIDLADERLETTTLRAATQPGSGLAPVTEAVLLGTKDGNSATARIGFIEKRGDRHWLAVDARLTNKLPESGLPILSGLDGLKDGAELSLGFALIHKPASVVIGTGEKLLAACTKYYEEHADRRPEGYDATQCAIDSSNEDDDDLLKAIAPHVGSTWGYSLGGRVALSRPQFTFRPTTDAAADTVTKPQQAFKLTGAVLTPANAAERHTLIDLFASWFVTFEASIGNDWESTKAQNLCSPVTGAVALSCQSVAVGEPFDQDVKTATISARRYLSDSIAVAPSWTKRWAERTDGQPAKDDGKWRVDLPLYFLSTEDKKGLSGGVAVSWVQGGGREYSVFVGAVLPPFEFK